MTSTCRQCGREIQTVYRSSWRFGVCGECWRAGHALLRLWSEKGLGVPKNWRTWLDVEKAA